jgi:hypothetical protein
MSAVDRPDRARLAENEEKQMRDGREDVANWFDRSIIDRMLPRRTRGITAVHVLGDPARRPGDPSRNSAATLTTRTQQPDPTPPGQGEWHGAWHQIVPGPVRRDLAYDVAYEHEHNRRAAIVRAFPYEGINRCSGAQGARQAGSQDI